MTNYCKCHFHEGESEHWGLLDRKSFEFKGSKPHFAPDTLILPKHLTLDLSFDWEEQRVCGSVVYDLIVNGSEVDSLELDAIHLDVSRVLVNSKSVAFENTGEKIRITFGKSFKNGTAFKIKLFHSTTRPVAGIYFTKPDAHYPDRFKTVWTQGQDEDSKYYFPCFDQPNFKQTTEVLLHLPPGMFGLSNGKLIEKKLTSKESFFHYKLELPYSTYLLSIVAGDFSEHRKKEGKVDVRWYVQKGREREGHNAFKDTGDILRFFSDYTGVPYPYPHYTQIAAPEFIFGGMENFTVTTQTDLTLHDDRAALDGDSNGLVAHEAAHTWFGNMVTAKSWAHAWLHESFATYFDALYTRESKGEDEFRYQLLENAETYFAEDTQYRRPIVTNVYKEPIDLFDAHLYPGGAVRLHNLKNIVSEDLFRKSLQLFLERHKYDQAETVDLQRALEETTGRNFDDWFRQWIFRGGYPVLEINYSWNNKGQTATVTVKQTQVAEKNGDADLFELPVDLRFYFAKGVENFSITVKEKQEKFYFKLRAQPKFFRLDPEFKIPCKKVKYEISRPLLRAQLKLDPDPIGRLEAAKALSIKPSNEDTVLLAERLLKEKFWGVAERIASALSAIGGDAARDGLLRGLKIKDAKTRRGVVSALAEFKRDEKVVKAVLRVAQADESYRVEASALATLGKLKDPTVSNFLIESLNRPSHNDLAQMAVYSGLTALEDESAWDILAKGADYGAPKNARIMAMRGLAVLAKRWIHRIPEALELYKRFANEDRGGTPAGVFRGKLGAISALKLLDDLRAGSTLRKLADSEPDGRLQRRAEETLSYLRENAKKPRELEDLREMMDDLLKENRSLRDRMDSVEKKSSLKSGKKKAKKNSK
jgi:aminopeptidase N